LLKVSQLQENYFNDICSYSAVSRIQSRIRNFAVRINFDLEMRKRYLAAGMILLSGLPLLAQTPVWNVYNTANSGLADNLVLQVKTDHRNVKFIGTELGGLSTFKTGWFTYNTLNTPLPDNEVTAIAFEQDSIVWAGADGGLLRFMSNAWTLFTPGNSGLPDVEVTAIATDGNIKWIGTEEGGLARYNNTSWAVYTPGNSGLSDIMVSALAVDTTHAVWTGSENTGLSVYNGSAWQNYTVANSDLPSNIITSIAVDQLNRVWVATEGGGLAMFHNNVWTVYSTGNSGIPSDDLVSVTVDTATNDIWVGTEGGGAARFNGSAWTIYNTGNSGLPENIVTSIAMDRDNGVWFGTENSGLARLCNAPVSTVTAQGPLAFCQGGNVVLRASPGASWQWLLNNVPVANGSADTLVVAQGGNYAVRVADSTACYRTSTAIVVTVHPLPAAPVVMQAGNMLSSSYPAGNQWYLNNVLISGATGQFYSPTEEGFYSVVHTDANGCTSTSSLFAFNFTGIDEESAVSVSIYPNPSAGDVIVQSTLSKIENVEVYDMQGKLLWRYSLPQSSVIIHRDVFGVRGIYIVKLSAGNTQRIQKLIIQ